MVGRGWAFLHFFLPLKICVCSNPACSVYLSFFFSVCTFHFEFYFSFLKEGGEIGMPKSLTRVHHKFRIATGFHKGVLLFFLHFSSVYIPCFTSVQSRLTLCNPMDCSMPGLPVHHHLPKLVQTHVHQVGDAIQPFHPVTPFFSCLQSLPTADSL